MVENQALAGADIVNEGLVGAVAPEERRLAAFEIVHHDEVIGSESFGAGAPRNSSVTRMSKRPVSSSACLT